MQCENCHRPVDTVSSGFVVCPHCGKVNIPPGTETPGKSKSHQALKTRGLNKLKPLGRLRFQYAALIIVSLVFLAGIGGVTVYRIAQPKPEPAPTVKVKNWQAEDTKLQQAQQLVAEGKLDEAVILLSQIDKEYPNYT